MGFIGENGAGKTTTIRLILDMVRRDSGSIEVLEGNAAKRTGEFWSTWAWCWIPAASPREMTGNEAGRVMAGFYKTWDREKFRRLLSDYHVDGKKRIREYSRGMKMKLSLAAAMSHESRLLILDEALNALDPMAREELLEAFQEFIMDEGHSIFLSSHILSDLEKISDYITFIHKGKILFSEEKDRLLETYGILRCDRQSLKGLQRARWPETGERLRRGRPGAARACSRGNQTGCGGA